MITAPAIGSDPISGQQLVAHRRAPALSTVAHQSAQNLVTAIGLGEAMGHAEAPVLSTLAAGSDHPAAAITT